ncbi:MAG: hypothetical protein QW376_09010 [Candidatus Caldarchaeum sp.]
MVDEWIWEEEILRNKQEVIFKFLNKVRAKCDRLVIIKNSPFVKKFYALCKRQHQAQDQIVRGIIRFFNGYFIYNLEKCVEYEETELHALPEDIEKEVKEDDRYLVRAYLTAQANILITTDTPLIEVVSKYSINCKHADEFLPWYITRGEANTQRERNLPTSS